MKKQTVALLIAVGVIVVSSIIFLSQKDTAPIKATTPVATEQKNLTAAEVATHASAHDCYTIVGGNIYNLTDWITTHPGGAPAILSLCGTDGTAPFTKQHGGDANAKAALALFLIGKVI